MARARAVTAAARLRSAGSPVARSPAPRSTRGRAAAGGAGALRAAVLDLRKAALAHEREHAAEIAAVAPAHRPSAVNLLHYLALRQRDLRPLQDRLTAAGLSSLGRSEGDVLASLDAVLQRLTGGGASRATSRVPDRTGTRRLAEHALTLFGAVPRGRTVRIMATMPGEAATDYALVRRLVQAGMGIARINCAHDDAAAWAAMARHVRRASASTRKPCRVLMDLAGPKLRTGALAPAEAVLRWKPVHDRLGAVIAPARVAIVAAAGAGAVDDIADADATLPASPELVGRLRPGDELRFADARGRKRTLRITARRDGVVIAEGDEGAYVTPGTALRARRDGEDLARGAVGAVAGGEEPIILHPGDTLVLTADGAPGHPARGDGRHRRHATVSCTLPEAFRDVRAGEAVWFDDGKIGGTVRRVIPGRGVGAGRIAVRIDHASPTGSALRADKGINLPDSDLDLPALTAKDRADLAVVTEHADLVGLSFVRSPEDVADLHRELARHGADRLGVILKIETRQGFAHLPRILLAGLRRPPVGVMVARGDLAVEAGFERLAEVQEEMLWLCEAAHAPVVWGTQVLEHLVKKGQPSRAEVTDAAMSGRAECVMLNKGPHLVEGVAFLADVLGRMGEHQEKKRSMLRRLSVSEMA